MKLVFLDIEAVVDTSRFAEDRHLNQQRVQTFCDLAVRCAASVVATSSWKLEPALLSLFTVQCERQGVTIISSSERGPARRKSSRLFNVSQLESRKREQAIQRSLEIQHWLQSRTVGAEKIEGWVIIDPSVLRVEDGNTKAAARMAVIIGDHTVRINGLRGFTEANLKKAVDVLDCGEGWPVPRNRQAVTTVVDIKTMSIVEAVRHQKKKMKECGKAIEELLGNALPLPMPDEKAVQCGSVDFMKNSRHGGLDSKPELQSYWLNGPIVDKEWGVAMDVSRCGALDYWLGSGRSGHDAIDDGSVLRKEAAQKTSEEREEKGPVESSVSEAEEDEVNKANWEKHSPSVRAACRLAVGGEKVAVTRAQESRKQLAIEAQREATQWRWKWTPPETYVNTPTHVRTGAVGRIRRDDITLTPFDCARIYDGGRDEAGGRGEEERGEPGANAAAGERGAAEETRVRGSSANQESRARNSSANFESHAGGRPNRRSAATEPAAVGSKHHADRLRPRITPGEVYHLLAVTTSAKINPHLIPYDLDLMPKKSPTNKSPTNKSPSKSKLSPSKWALVKQHHEVQKHFKHSVVNPRTLPFKRTFNGETIQPAIDGWDDVADMLDKMLEEKGAMGPNEVGTAVVET
jgi:hypothetical protein